MNKRSVFVLQESKSSAEEIAAMLTGGEFEVIGVCCDGQTAIEELKRLDPDYLVTGVISFTLDGLEVIKRLKKEKLKAKPIVVSAISREEIILKAMELGALYYMVKPVDKNVLRERLIEIGNAQSRAPQVYKNEEKRPQNIDEKISKIFISVGIPPHIKGYAYLREGVKMAIDSPQIINSITKQLYPSIGEKYSTSASKVERAIRHAIEVAWNRGRIDSINSVFGVRAYVGSEKPTNGEFIALVADKMILEGA
ncbi:MAG: sporulation transcription factor Spo0A [Clostridia bacterium]|nr:sporulation transcription factor Spo0A [Clostridia bacterium]